VIELPIGRHPRAPHLRAVRQQGGKPAKTSFTVVARASRSTLLRLTLETGRTHQIRVHLAAIGHPIVGDAAYGARRLPPSELRKFPALHAASLTFRHPLSGEEHRYESPLPEDFRGLLTSIEDQIPRLDS
ncbi:MAG: 23S rRNA pseudouridylate synthase, partial [Deltaproteobacteria bacterium]